MNEFILASTNPDKVEELSRYLSPSIMVEMASQSIEVCEDGDTFEANAFKKAFAYYKKLKCPVVADDSGIEVEALSGELGVRSARFGGPELSDRQRVEKLLEEMKGQSNRNAHFSCSLCFYLSPEEIFFFEGRLPGSISDEYRGAYGFGYDPVFIPSKGDGAFTLAERPEWKDENSHRAQACHFAKLFFESVTSLA